MKILQSTIERLLYLLLVLTFISIIVVGIFAYQDGQEIKQLLNSHTEALAVQAQETKEVKLNQYTNTIALEQWWREGVVCLVVFPANPLATNAQKTSEVNNCFTNSPEVK